MPQFDAAHAWDIGYDYASCGICRNVPAGTWIADFGRAFGEGWDAAVADKRWATNEG